MKTSTLIMLGGVAAVAYYIATRKATSDAVTSAVSALRAVTATTPVVVVDARDEDYYPSPSSWALPTWGARAWRGGGGRGHHGHGGGGHHGHGGR